MSDALDPKNLESLMWDARARIMWGEAIDKVADSLMEQGVDSDRVDELIRACLKERAADIRRRGISELFIGVGIIVLAGLVIVGMFSAGFIAGKLFAACVVAAFYGFYRGVRGGFWLWDGARTRGSIATLDDSII